MNELYTAQILYGRIRNDKLSFKKDVTYIPNSFIYNRDLKGLATSEIELVGINLGINRGDMLYLEDKIGTIREITEEQQLTTKLVLNFNSDAINHEVYGLTEYTILSDYNPDTYSFLTINAIGNYILLFQNTSQTIDSVLRRILLCTQVIETLTILPLSDTYTLSLVRDTREAYKMRLDDPLFNVLTENYSQSGVNQLILVAQDTQNIKAYTMDDSGIVRLALDNDTHNIQVAYLEVETNAELDDITIAQSYFSNNNEAFEIVIDMPLDYLKEDLNLSREIDLYLRDERLIHTKVTKIKETNQSREITLGLSRSSYFDVVRKDVK